MTLSHSDMKLGLRVAAPIKRGEHKRLYEECELTWVSKDGRVVEATTVNPRAKRMRSSFACSDLRPVGTASPELGVVL